LYDKSIRMPIDWILSETDYEYYFRIDSDSFVHPSRFDWMITENLSNGIPHYMGCAHPAASTNPYESFKYVVCREGTIASGCGYMVSRAAMKVAKEKLRIDEDIDYEIDDWALGRAMWENQVPLIHDSRILFESKHKPLAADPHNIGLPYIGDTHSHLAIQHYMNGYMEEAMITLGYRNN
jgi:hypothetical protein